MWTFTDGPSSPLLQTRVDHLRNPVTWEHLKIDRLTVGVAGSEVASDSTHLGRSGNRGHGGTSFEAIWIKGFTGISDPYEPSDNAEITLDSSNMTEEEGVDRIMVAFKEKGYLGGD